MSYGRPNLPPADRVGTPIADEIVSQFDRLREDAADDLQEIIHKATRELEVLQTSANFTLTDWVERPAQRYHDRLVEMKALSGALMTAVAYESKAQS